MSSMLMATVDAVLAQAMPNVGGGAAPPGSGKFELILRWAMWIAFGVGVMGFFAAGAMMAVSARRGEGGEHASRLGWVMAGCVVVASSTGIVGALAA